MWLTWVTRVFLSPCFLRCCRPWCCSFPSVSLPRSPQRLHPAHWAERLCLRREDQSGLFLHSHVSWTHCHDIAPRQSYLQMCRLEPPPLWRSPGGAASVWRCELFSSPETKTDRALRLATVVYETLLYICSECCPASVASAVTDTYINEVLGVENIRDLVAKQILFSSSKTLDVDMLDHHLESKTFYYSFYCHHHIWMKTYLKCIFLECDSSANIPFLVCLYLYTDIRWYCG